MKRYDSEIEELMQRAEAENDGWAMVRLGNIYADNDEYDKAYEWYLKAEKTDDYDAYDATFNIANMYYYGWYLKQDYQEAYDRYKWLASLDYSYALFYMGLYAENGFLGAVDYKKAVEYYEEAIELGDELSATNLGRMYSLGIGVDVDLEKGFAYYVKAYELGDDLACANVGYCYQVGQGVKKNKWKAIRYYYEGAKRGEENSIENLKQYSDREVRIIRLIFILEGKVKKIGYKIWDAIYYYDLISE